MPSSKKHAAPETGRRRGKHAVDVDYGIPAISRW
jgi:hypothetical protein